MGNLFQIVATAPTIDTSVISVIGDVATEILNLFTVYPINIFLTLSIVGVVVGIVLRVKRS